MNAERLHVIALAILNDVQKTETDTHLNNLGSALQNQINTPQDPSHQQKVSETLTTLYEKLESAPSNDFSPAWRQVLEEFSVENLFGEKLKNTLREIFERNQITLPIVLEEVKELSKTLNEFIAPLNKIIEGFQQLGIGAEELEPGECELGFLVPREAIDNDLNEFTKELEEFNRIFNSFSELVTKNRPGFKIKTISSSDLTVYLEALPVVGAAIVFAIERIVNLYKQLLEIRRIQNELDEQKGPKKAIVEIEKYANSFMGKEIKKLNQEIFKKFSNIKDPERKKELSNEIRISLNQIANRYDKGYNIEIRAEPIVEEGDEGEPNKVSPEVEKYIQMINSSSKVLQFMKLEGSPILSLPEPKFTKKK